ncbi:ABC transporter ATP-binding protein [Lichenifustis flavocetrariae]|uniref:Sn-glycerol-3-phosphate ABC transporter ATP-binding protein UgpC n=1 Tax=Lichenifustis flavocetrariae TaxID=2949735 RepID=A0AA41YTV9_9HYPH|nr:sn-glycerol-3-phosphate ABC transporter ATP-binding protein UgpC [Lichenifustis flavocetrariae]MCW6506937.1 sn-glycerol-3-phosphate ABC transporter ATP-binding protein UgpC [Lichenifustis flavocetrariae]
MASIELRHVSKRYAPTVYGVRDVSLRIEDGEFIIFLGPSGCGKSTTLRMIAGLESVSDGEILIGGQAVNAIPPRDRNVAVVFQSYALYPHMSVAQNMAFGLKMRGTDPGLIRSKVDQAATLLGLTPYLDRKPAALSGGQRQRVALGRAIVRDPAAFLLDEPLSNLDAQLRGEMRLELVKLHRRLGRTIVHVTHDQVEAMTMGDRICIMRGGAMIQVGRPLEVYANPAETFVARFLATPPMNLMPAVLRGAGGDDLVVETGEGLALAVPSPYRSAYAAYRDKPVILGLRPEDFYEAPHASDWQPVPFTVVAVEALGAELVLVGQVGATGGVAPQKIAPPQEIAVRLSRHVVAEPGQMLTLSLDPNPMHLFDVETTRLIPRPAPGVPARRVA